MSLSAVVERRSGTSDSVGGNQPTGMRASIDREPILRLVEGFPSIFFAGSTDSQQERRSEGSSFGDLGSVDFAWIPAPRPDHARPQATLHALQEWEGFVVGIGSETFEARLLDVTAGDRCDSAEATIPLQEIAHGDLERMEIGSIFRWVIGHEISSAGSKRRVSQIVFRDLPTVTLAAERAGSR